MIILKSESPSENLKDQNLKLLYGCAVLFGIVPAFAAAHPPILPQQDVAVSYDLEVSGRPDTAYQLEYSAAAQRARLTSVAQGTVFLVNIPAGSAQIIVPMLHAIVQAPDLSRFTQQVNDAGNAQFTALGKQHYAGHECENYLVTSPKGSATACLTPDGVALHFHGSNDRGEATVTATALRYGAQPPGDFAVPDGFSQVTLPPGMLAQILQQ